jgi:cobalamin biosynthesis Mg chelatase CobN
VQLVDAIEAWGRAHRSAFDSEEAEVLADVWRTVRASEHASLDVATMTKDEARAVMAVFPTEQRSSVASTLNKVRKWTLAQANEAEAPETEAAQTEEPPTEEPPMAEPLTGEPLTGEVALADPVAPDDGMVTIDGSSLGPSARETVRTSGPVEGWQPPTTVDDPPMAIDQRIILGLIGLVIAVVLVWFLFLRGDDAAVVDPVDDGPDTVEDVISITNQAFLDQFELSDAVGECLVAEFGDLASAATDATLRERQVCGTSLLQIITGAS